MSERETGLYILEGPSGSGKDSILKEMSAQGIIVLRGLASHNPKDNLTLVPEARQLVGSELLSFKEDISLPQTELTSRMGTVFEIARLQHNEALKLLSEGNLVLLNRSALSLAALRAIRGYSLSSQFFTTAGCCS